MVIAAIAAAAAVHVSVQFSVHRNVLRMWCMKSERKRLRKRKEQNQQTYKMLSTQQHNENSLRKRTVVALVVMELQQKL